MRTLESKRLVLRQFGQDDLKDVASWEEGPAEQRTFEAQGFLDFCFQSHHKWGMSPWGMLHKEDQKVIGNCGFCRIDFKVITGEVNYYVAKRYRNQGLASEALQLVIMFGFEELGLAEIWASCDLENKSSERVLQKDGFRFLRTINSTRDHNHRQKLYAITRSEYRAMPHD
jgi:[ribosomal protein S5]-alanine N-acetyltransferase